MVGWHHRLNGHEFESTPGVGDRQGGLAGAQRSPVHLTASLTSLMRLGR